MPSAWKSRIVIAAAVVGILAGVLMWLGEDRNGDTTAEVIVAVAPRPELDRAVSGPLLERMVAKYRTFAAADSTLQAAAEPLGVRLDDVRSATFVTVAAGTANITISVTLADGERAWIVANEVARRTIERSVGDPLVRVALISSKSDPVPRSRALRSVIAMVAVSLAAGLASAALMVRFASILYRAGLT